MFFVTTDSRGQIFRVFCTVGIVWILMLAAAASVDAHNVTVFAWVDGDTVHVESKFSGGRRPKGAPIEVYDSSDHLLLTGVTDDNGEFTFTVPRKTAMKVVLQAGMGHKAEWIIPVEDLQETDRTAKAVKGPDADNRPAPVAPAQPSAKADSPVAFAAAGGPTEAQIERAVEKALDRKLKPVMKMLSESRPSGPQLRDILGGLGYIIGLVGLSAYLRYRRSSRSSEPPAAGNP